MAKAIDKNTPSVSVFHNLSIGEIVDALGHVKAEAAEIDAREKIFKAELIARGVTEAEGMLFRATLTEATRWTLDAERIRTEMGQHWYTAHCRVGVATTLRVSARRGMSLPIAA